jgi:hypothetical protein
LEFGLALRFYLVFSIPLNKAVWLMHEPSRVLINHRSSDPVTCFDWFLLLLGRFRLFRFSFAVLSFAFCFDAISSLKDAACVGTFKQSNTHKFMWFGNLPTPRSYWCVLIKLSNNTNNKTRRKTSLLNSTLSSSLSLCFLLLCILHTLTLQLFTEHIYIY